MKKKILFLGLSFFLVASLVAASALSSCKKASSTTSMTTTTSTTTTAKDTPKYGGTLTVFTDWGNEDPGGFDANLSPRVWSTSVWCNPYLGWLALGDVEKYGPRGSNASKFLTSEFVPEQYLGGQIAQSWEISTDLLHLTFNIRHGIKWSGNTTIGMTSRELNANDVVYSLKRSFSAPIVGGLYSFVTETKAADNYTVNLTFARFDANWAYYIMYGYMPGNVMCPESGDATVGAGGNDWKNAVSDGPFIITDYTSGTSCTYTKNPDYWGKTTIKGVQYQMPFIDKLVYPIIVDESTQLANLRTGKIDWWGRVPSNYGASLKQTSPDMIQDQYLSGRLVLVKLNRLDNQYLKNKAVRRALWIATDFATVRDLLWPGGDILGWPMTRGDPAYTPIENLPASTKQLFTYDAAAAKKMLADAGYPNGFSLSLTISSTDATEGDLAQWLVGQWAKIGVTATINALDPTAKEAVDNVRKFDAITEWYSTNNPIVPMSHVQASTATQNTRDVYTSADGFEAMYQTILKNPDPVSRTAQEKELGIAMNDDAGWIPFANPNNLNCYWPWMKNYFGEVDTGYHNAMPMIERLWIDQALKTSLGK